MKAYEGVELFFHSFLPGH